MEANLNQFRLLTVEGEQVANAQRRGSHGDDSSDLKGSQVKHRLVYEDCPFYDSAKNRLQVDSMSRSFDHISSSDHHHHRNDDRHHHHHQLHQHVTDLFEPATCDHPNHNHHHHRRRHSQFGRYDSTFHPKSRSLSSRQASPAFDADDDDDDDDDDGGRDGSWPSLRTSEIDAGLRDRDKTPEVRAEANPLWPRKRKSDKLTEEEEGEEEEEEEEEEGEGKAPCTSAEARKEPECRCQCGGSAERNLIGAMRSLERTVALHCQLLSRRMARDRTSVVRKGNNSSEARRHRSSQSAFLPSSAKSNVRTDKVVVSMRVIFLKIGEIDTMKENFMADAFVQARWREPAFDGLQEQFLTSQSVDDIDWDKYWNPKLYVENSLGEPKETIWQTLSYGARGEATVYERRRIKGCFLENLELDDFPFDTQELTLTITSERSDTELDLIEDNVEISSINVQSFVDEQEWALHSHVETWKCITTKIFQNSKLKHPSFSTSCRASRRAGFYIWNIFLVMLFICSLTFATFSVELTKPENRLQLSFILLLTTITFKFVVSQTLPRISYLTYLDKYILTSMGILCGVCVWHAVVPLLKHDPEVARVADKWGLAVFSSAYFLFHLFFFLFIYIMALKRRWKYDQKDRDHKERVRKLQMLQEQQNRPEAEAQSQTAADKSDSGVLDFRSPLDLDEGATKVESKINSVGTEGGNGVSGNTKANPGKCRRPLGGSSRIGDVETFQTEDV